MTKIGDIVILNGEDYKVVGTIKKSFLLERNGKQYKATQEKINKIEAQNSKPKSEYPYLEQRLAFMRIFKKDAQLPKGEAEIMSMFEDLVGELSPDCDGEASRSQVAHKLRSIKGAWSELEKMLGRKVSESEVENKIMAKHC